MAQAEQLRDEVGRVGRLLEAGHRGVPIGGELLVAFGVALGLLGALGAATAFGYLPAAWALSPIGCASGFLAFAVLFKGVKERLSATILVSLGAAAAGEAAWRAAVAALPEDKTDAIPAVMSLVAAPVLMVALGVVIGLWRLARSAHAASPANRALVGAWLGLAAAMAAIIALCIIFGVRSGNWFGVMFLPGLFWILWGAGWCTSAAMTHSRWMYGVAAGSWALAIYYAATSGIFSSAIVGFVALVIVPGVQLMREARTTHEA